MKKAFVTGITGQDGAYLAESLLDKGYEVHGKGYEVHGLVHRSSTADVNDHRLRWLGIADRVRMIDGDLTDLSGLIRTVREIQPDEVYNLAAQSFVQSSRQQPLLTSTVTGLGTANILKAVRPICPGARFYQASSSEMHGLIQEPCRARPLPSTPACPVPPPSSMATG